MLKANTVYTPKFEKQKLWAEIQANIGEYSRIRARDLVFHLYDKGYSYQDVASVIGTSRQYVEKVWPKEGK